MSFLGFYLHLVLQFLLFLLRFPLLPSEKAVLGHRSALRIFQLCSFLLYLFLYSYFFIFFFLLGFQPLHLLDVPLQDIALREGMGVNTLISIVGALPHPPVYVLLYGLNEEGANDVSPLRRDPILVSGVAVDVYLG